MWKPVWPVELYIELPLLFPICHTHRHTAEHWEPMPGSCFLWHSPLRMCGFAWYPPSPLFHPRSIPPTCPAPLLIWSSTRCSLRKRCPRSRLTEEDVLMKAWTPHMPTDIVLVLLHGNRVPMRQYVPIISVRQSQTLVLWYLLELSFHIELQDITSTDTSEYECTVVYFSTMTSVQKEVWCHILRSRWY